DFSNAGLAFANTGAQFADGAFSYSGRITALPLAQCEDHHLLHLGVSYTWRSPEEAQNDRGLGVSGPRMLRFRARPELRDAIGGFGDNQALPGDAGRLVDTGAMVANGASVLGTELFYIQGPFSVMAEWAFASAVDAIIPVRRGGRTTNVTGDRNFHRGCP